MLKTMEFRFLYALFFYILNNCAGSASGHVTDDMKESVLFKLQDLKTKFEKLDTDLTQQFRDVGFKLSGVEERNILLQDKLGEIGEQMDDVKAHDETNQARFQRIDLSLLRAVDKRLQVTENALTFLLSDDDILTAESFDKYRVTQNVSSEHGNMSLRVAMSQQKKGFRIKKPKNEKGRRAFTLKPPATVTPSTISTGSNVNHVGFTAFLTKDVNSLFTYLIVPFDNVIINDGQGFDTSRYMFTCPVSGMYLFSSAIYSLHQNRLEVEIVKEGAMLFRVYAVGTCEYPLTPDQGFNSGIVRCNAGERVWARIYQYSSFATFPSSKYSSFSGQLLWSL